jgi:phage terminase large subunit GpA-like protein
MSVMMRTPLPKRNAVEEVQWFLQHLRPRSVRTLREFAEEEIVVVDGPEEGARYSALTQPVHAAWMFVVQSGRFRRHILMAPKQWGKSLLYAIVTLYHLFELERTVVLGAPMHPIIADKWSEDLLPVIDRTRYKQHLPRTGEGSRDGDPRYAVRFRNGSTLRFMTAKGDDKSRSSFTAETCVMTELDGMDQARSDSREGSPIAQIEARTDAWGEEAQTFGECTVSTAEGATWQEYLHGSGSSVSIRCPHCHDQVCPDREHLIGWQEAETEGEAQEETRVVCPGCGVVWNDDDRRAAHEHVVILHRGQTWEKGRVVGEEPSTETFALRVNCISNLFMPLGRVGVAEWRAARSSDRDAAERDLVQRYWALPGKLAAAADLEDAAAAIAQRGAGEPRGVVPDWANMVTVGVDIGKWRCWYSVIAWGEGGRAQVVDYGQYDVPSADMAVERAIRTTLAEMADAFASGWPWQGRPHERLQPALIMYDAGWQQDEAVLPHVRSRGIGHVGCKGVGGTEYVSGARRSYRAPLKSGAVVIGVGEGYHAVRLPGGRGGLVEIDVDRWKSWAVERLRVPIDDPTAMTLHAGTPTEHSLIATHATAESEITEFRQGRGWVTKWQRQRKHNHLLDTLMLASVGGHVMGVRLAAPEQLKRPTPAAAKPRRKRPAVSGGWNR